MPFLVLLLVSGVLLSRALVANAQAARYAAQTRLEVSELGDLLGLMLNMETGMRGFVITGAEPFVEPYRTARAQWPQALQVLRDQAAQFEGPERAAREAHLNRLSALMERWQNEVAEPELKLRLVSKERAEAVVASGHCKVLTDQIRAELAAYGQTAEQLLVSREAKAEQNFRLLQNTLLIAGLAVLLGVTLAAWWGADWLSKQFGAVGHAARGLSQGRSVELPASSLTE